MSSFPPLRKLHYVLAVARELHFRKAAERLHTSQPSLSRQIRELEEEIGFEIFYRNRHVVALTEAGKSFIVVVNDMLSRIDVDFRRARILPGRPHGRARRVLSLGIRRSCRLASNPKFVRSRGGRSSISVFSSETISHRS